MPQASTDTAASSSPTFLPHGASEVGGVEVVAYNAELRDAEGFVGDRASKSAFVAILEDWRERLREVGEDPLGDTPSDEIRKKTLDALLRNGDPEAAGVVHGAVEEFANELAAVASRLLRLEAWKATERILVGGGLRASRVGELAIGRASVLLKAGGHAIDLVPIRHDPDEAGLIGTIHLAPSWTFAGYDAALGVDIGGTNLRAGVVRFGPEQGGVISDASVGKSQHWRHSRESPKRDEVVERIASMLQKLIGAAKKEDLSLAPFIGIGCPGVIDQDGAIARGGQNLPGNWESNRFNLANALREHIPKIGERDTNVVIHNDAVVQGLSELPFQTDVAKWGVLTIGTGLGNAVFARRGGTRRR